MPPRLDRILLTTSTFPRDEDDPVTARFVLDLATHLAAHARVVVLAPGAPGAPARARWGEVEVRRFTYFLPASRQRLTAGEGILAAMRASPLARAQLPLLVAAQWAALPAVLREVRPDVVNAHWIVPQGLVAAAWRRRLGAPLVLSAHGADVAFLARSAAGPSLARFVLGRAQHLVSDSASLVSTAERLVGRAVPSTVIPMGVRPAQFRPGEPPAELRRSPRERVVLFVGKLVPKKGVAVLLEAVAALRAGGLPLRLVVVGGGPLEASLRARGEALSLGEAVEWRGWTRNDRLPGLYRGADVVCVPSVTDPHGETEGTPVVLQEALAAGAVVVGSRSAGLGEVLVDGRNGFLAPPGDAGGLAAALGRALDLPGSARAAIATAARETALESGWDRVALRHLDAYRAAQARLAAGDDP